MAHVETFDDFDSSERVSDQIEQRPFSLREDKSDDGTLLWLNQNYDEAERVSQSRLLSYLRWSAMYKGYHWRSQDTRTFDREAELSSRKPKLVDNFIKEFIDNKVAQMARFKSSFTAIPWNNEQSDINNAKGCEKLLEARNYTLDMDKINRDADKIKYKYGTVFVMVKWDKEDGPENPEYKKLLDIYDGKIPKKVLKELGDVSLKLGDIEVYAQTPDRIFPELYITDPSKIKHFDEISWANVYELKEDYPEVANDINEGQREYYDYTLNNLSRPANTVMVREFYHIPTKYLPEGIYIKYTDDVILEQGAFPFKHGKLPYIMDRDIELDHEFWGRPSTTQIEAMQRYYNNILSSQARDLGQGSAPKWLVPKGSTEFRSLNNEFTIAEYKGAQPPILAKGNPISSDGITIQDRLEKRMGQHMKVYDISRGEVPQGITANSALRFLDEQESQILAPDEQKRKSRIISTYRLMGNIAGQFYTKDDERMVHILGKNNEYLIKSIKKANFNQVYDIQLQNTSALPDTKTGKIAAIVDINMATQTDPVFGKEDVIQMMDLGMSEQFIDEATASVTTAKTLIEEILSGEEVPQPELSDDLMVHYPIFYRAVQTFQFKTRVDSDIQKIMYSHIKTIEGLLYLKASQNGKLAMELQGLNYFPSFFTLPEITPPPVTGGGAPAPGGEMDTSKMEHANKAIDDAKKSEVENGDNQ